MHSTCVPFQASDTRVYKLSHSQHDSDKSIDDLRCVGSRSQPCLIAQDQLQAGLAIMQVTVLLVDSLYLASATVTPALSLSQSEPGVIPHMGSLLSLLPLLSVALAHSRL